MRNSMDGFGAAARFSFPQNVALDGAGNLYITDNGMFGSNGATVRKLVLATGAVTTVVGVPSQTGVLLGPLLGGLNQARGLAVMPNQGLVISDAVENVVLVVRGL